MKRAAAERADQAADALCSANEAHKTDKMVRENGTRELTMGPKRTRWGTRKQCNGATGGTFGFSGRLRKSP
jgi:hypothetical protein